MSVEHSMKRLRPSFTSILRRLASQKSGDYPTMDDAKKLAEEKTQAEYTVAIDKYVDVPLRDLSDQVRSLVHQINASAERSNETQNRHHNEQLSLQKSNRKTSIALSILTLIVSLLTLTVLYLNLVVYRGQATIMATQAAIMEKQRTISDKAGNAAQESANAAIASVRAWVAVVDWIPPPPERANDGIGIKIRNVGKTSGLSAQVREEAFFLAPSEKEPTFTECPSTEPTSFGNTIEPEDKSSPPIPPLPLSRKLDSKEIGALGHGSRLILHGCITYKNVVGPTNQPLVGLTEFCSIFYGHTDKNWTEGCGSGNQMK